MRPVSADLGISRVVSAGPLSAAAAHRVWIASYTRPSTIDILYSVPSTLSREGQFAGAPSPSVAVTGWASAVIDVFLGPPTLRAAFLASLGRTDQASDVRQRRLVNAPKWELRILTGH